MYGTDQAARPLLRSHKYTQQSNHIHPTHCLLQEWVESSHLVSTRAVYPLIKTEQTVEKVLQRPAMATSLRIEMVRTMTL